jgi:hypothetical protein
MENISHHLEQRLPNTGRAYKPETKEIKERS